MQSILLKTRDIVWDIKLWCKVWSVLLRIKIFNDVFSNWPDLKKIYGHTCACMCAVFCTI